MHVLVRSGQLARTRGFYFEPVNLHNLVLFRGIANGAMTGNRMGIDGKGILVWYMLRRLTTGPGRIWEQLQETVAGGRSAAMAPFQNRRLYSQTLMKRLAMPDDQALHSIQYYMFRCNSSERAPVFILQQLEKAGHSVSFFFLILQIT